MSNNTKTNRTPSLIYVVCTIGLLSTIQTFLLWTTELAYMVGQWYENFLLISILSVWISLVGVMFMKKWAAVAYFLTISATQIILFKYNVMWSCTSLIVPILVTLVVGVYFKKMN